MSFQLEVFYDPDCPLCTKEVNWLSRLDRHDRIQFVDLKTVTDETLTYGQLMAEIHARTADGTLIRGADVFRKIYSEIGWRTLARASRLPIIKPAIDAAYKLFARHRLALTGRQCDESCHTNPSPKAK